MAFTDDEIQQHLQTLETDFWAYRRPPEDMRDQIREGQRIKDQSIELFLVRPSFADPSKSYEESIAKLRYVRCSDSWKLYWKRADLKWHSYPEAPEVDSLNEGLAIIHEDAFCCFFG